jgi:hypothetical protein
MIKRSKRTADEHGFTMVSVMLSMMILGLFTVGAWAAANGDIKVSRGDQDRKRAYEAAEAGIQWYTYQLERNPNIWQYCASPPSGAMVGLNNKGSRTSWRTLPDSGARFAVELIPAGSTACNPAQANTSAAALTMLSSGVLRLRSTGRSNGATRQIVSTFRRSSFLDFLWYTKWETLPPGAAAYYGKTESWALTNCDTKRASRSTTCAGIQFPSGDTVAGPMHTEDDSLLVCGSPTFGRGSDRIEVRQAATQAAAYKQNGGCSGSPTTKNTLVAPSKQLGLPSDNTALKNFATYTYSGNTCLDFSGSSVTVYERQTNWSTTMKTNTACAGTPTETRALTQDTVIWIDHNGTCTESYDYYQQYNDSASCGTVAVRGDYSTNITIGAARDIIVRGNVTKTGNGMLGLVAGNYVRVYHPVTPANYSASNDCTGNATAATVNQIDAAILATRGSFITDNWDCGAPLGYLKVTGAIAQYWRGAVGQGSASAPTHGYLKNYIYDDRLKYSEPPQFLDPVDAAWHVLRQSEQSPVLTG